MSVESHEATIAVMQRDIEYLKDAMDKMTNKLDSFVDTADKKYAAKYVERSVTAFIWIIVVAVLGGILKLIIKVV